ncbi:acyl-CoA thioesterase [bacterium]|nr:acyl-CoA thioesterase [bacterium]
MPHDGHAYQTRVRYAEIDRMGVAYHSRYIEWYEAARTDMLRDRGFPYKALEERGIFLPVIELNNRFLKPVFYDELVTVYTSVEKITRLKLHLTYRVFGEANDQLRAEGYTIHCFINDRGEPFRVDPRVVQFISGEAEMP